MTDTAFPGNVVEVIMSGLESIGENMSPSVAVTILDRPIRTTDPAFCVAAFPLDWRPMTAYEIDGGRLPEPLLPRYNYEIQASCKVAEQGFGLKMIGNISKFIRAMLYRDPSLRVALQGLNETAFGYLERVQRYGIAEQLFYSNQVSGQFMFLSTAHLWVEVETTPT